MSYDKLKKEIVDWIWNLEEKEIIYHVKAIKEKMEEELAVGNLSEREIEGIKRGMKDAEEGNLVPHEEVKKKYGL